MTTDRPTPQADAEAAAPRSRGRPVSARSRDAAMTAAVQLLEEHGYRRFTIDEVARRSGVSKATIYKHWTNGFALAVTAYGQRVTDAVPVVRTGDALTDLRALLVALARFYASPRGSIVAELLGASVGSAQDSALIRDEFFAARRTATVDVIVDGQQRGTIRADMPADLVIDMVFGALVFRLLNGRGALRASEARAIADALTTALRPPPPRRRPARARQSRGDHP